VSPRGRGGESKEAVPAAVSSRSKGDHGVGCSDPRRGLWQRVIRAPSAFDAGVEAHRKVTTATAFPSPSRLPSVPYPAFSLRRVSNAEAASHSPSVPLCR